MFMKRKLTLMLLCMVVTITAWAQSAITGTVVSATDNEPVIGASVKVKGASQGTVTDVNGKFTINVQQGKMLVFSYIGMETAEVAAKNNMVVILNSDDTQLEEIVVLGYGTQKKLGSVVGAVSTVSNAKLQTSVTPNFTDALAGQVSGLSVLSSSGDPSASASIRLRGVNSINSSNEPLYILDGAPVSSSVFNTLNPADIQNITVLKDAASTAIYGSRAANGVIVITSRKGKFNERANITLRAQYGISNPVEDGIDMMNSEQYVKFRDLIGQPVSDDIRNLVSTYGISTKWRDEVIKNDAPTYTLDAVMSGGGEMSTYYLSFNHHNQEGIIDQSGMHRETIRANVDAKLNNYFKVGFQANLGSNTYETNNESSAADLYLTNPMIFSRMAMPYDSPYYYTVENGKIVYGDRAEKLKYSNMQTPYFTNKNREVIRKRITLNLNTYEQLTPIKGLTLRAQQAIDGYDQTLSNVGFPYDDITTPMGSVIGKRDGWAQTSFSRYTSYTFTHTADYKLNLGDHYFNVLVGEESILSKSRSFGVATSGQTDVRQLRLTDGTTISIEDVSDSRAEEAFNAVFGTLSYSFADKYFLDFTLRTDGSSRFAPGHRWGTFYSVGGMWDAKKEKFLKDVKWLNEARLRASYGTTGNASGTGSYGYLGLFGAGSKYNGESSIGISQPSNNTLTWETVGALNIGTTLRFADRVTVNFDFYEKKTSDMLMDIPYSYTTGFGSGVGNIGGMKNTGFDAEVIVDVLKTKDITWTFKANVNNNKNEITELFAGRDEYIIANTGIKLEVGKPFGEFYSVRYAGVDPRDGKPMWYDKNDNLTKVWNEEENSVFVGKQRYAPWSGGFGTTFSWKGLTVTADFAWQAGKYMLNNDNFFCMNANQGTNFNQAVDMLNVWTTPGQITDIPAYGEQVQFDTHLLENASFLRMKSLIVQYNLPQKWIAATHALKNAKVFFTGRNLFTITSFSGYDPEPDINLVKFNYPNTRQYVLGLELTF